ncbi:MAG: LysM peptidoglycan-binding domain-containing protein [Oscillochloridaceae bacterium umkhey_bin13]
MSHRTAPHDHALLEDLLRTPVHSLPPAPWAAPVRLRPRALATRGDANPRLRVTRSVAVAGTLLLTAGIVAGSIGAMPVRAAQSNVTASVAVAAVITPDHTAQTRARLAPLSIARAVHATLRAEADAALLTSLLASEPGSAVAAPASATAASARLAAARAEADTALLASLLASEPSAVAASSAATAPATAVSFATVNALPAAAQVYRLAPLRLPALTLAQQTPPPPGYQQPPGYMDGVPFGGQIGAVPGSAAARPPANTTRPPTTTRPSVPTTYVVQPGDTLTSIALRFYGDASVAPLIWEVNFRVIGPDPNRIIAGQRLTLPVVPGRPVLRPTGQLPQGPIARPGQYTIQPRDFLRWMAQRAYGNEMRWREIYNANRNVLGPNPDLIYPGVRVFVP